MREAPVQPTPAQAPVQPTLPQRRRSAWLIPLILSSATLTILVAAIVVLLVVRPSASPSADSSTDPSGGRSTGDAQAHPCPVGTWTVTEYTEKVAVDGVGDVTFVGKGAEVRLRADGTGVIDYKAGTVFTATISGTAYKLVVTGQITYSYRLDAGTMTFSDVKANGKETVTRQDTGESVSDDLGGTLEPARYTCSGDALTEYTDRFNAAMARLSRTA
jgi:hypothetical protein